MPTPHPETETQEAWMSRCIPFVLDDGTASSQAQAVAICASKWEDAHKPKKGFAMNRAYSTIKITKTFEDERIIEGVASTPTPDRIGDIVNPMGAKFTVPMPLLWQHKSDQPIGNVIYAKPAPDGILFTAKIAKSLELGKLKDRLDEAWQSIKLGLVRAVSIGFAPIKYEFLKDGTGIEFKEWDWLELSAVTIPANTEASINIIRAIDTELRTKAMSWSCGASRDLPIDDSSAWDGSAAQASMFAAGFDTARRGHLAYDSSAPDLKGSYKLPFARVSGGRLEALASGVRAAASRLPQTDIPAGVAASARAVLDHYEMRMKPGDSGKELSPSIVPTIEGSTAGVSATKHLSLNFISPGVSGNHKPVKVLEKSMAKKTVAEQISAFEATRQAKAARLTELMEDAAEKGETLGEPEKQEYDTLESEVKSVDEHLVRLHKLQVAQAEQAKPAEGKTQEEGTVTRGAGIVASVRPNMPQGIGMARMVIAKMRAFKDNESASQVAERLWPSNPEISMALKTAVAPGDTTTSGWASQLTPYQNLASEFIEFLRPMTLLGKIQGFRRVPFNVQIPRATAGTSGHWVGEGVSKPLGKMTFDSVTLRWAKAAGIVAFTDELARFSNPSVEALVRDDLARGISQFLDEQFLDPSVIEATNVSPASITNGADTAAASGTTYADLVDDVKGAFAILQAAYIPVSGAVWVLEPSQAVALSLMQNPLGQPQFPGITVNGGTLFGLPVYTSESAGSGQVTLFKPGECLLADDGGFAIDISREASLHMDDIQSDTAKDLVSLWQNNLVAVRCERYINWKMRRDNAVAYLTGCDYGGSATTF